MRVGGRLFPHRPRQKVGATGNRAGQQRDGEPGGFPVARGNAHCLPVWLESVVRKWVPFPLSGISSLSVSEAGCALKDREGI